MTLWALLAGALSTIVAFLTGHRQGKRAEEIKALREWKEKRDAMDQVERGDDPVAARERLRERGKP